MPARLVYDRGMLLSPSLAFVLTFALTGAPAGPATVQPAPPTGLVFPYEDAGACPTDGCRYGRWVAVRSLTVHRTREAGAAAVFRVGAGEAVDAVTGVVVTLRPGRARAIAPIEVEGVRVATGEHVLLLHSAGKGAYKVSARGAVVDTALDVAGRHLAVLSEPRTVWWVQVRNRRGEVGWTSQPEAFGG